MKRNLSVLFCLFFVLPAVYIYAGQIFMSTSYPAPTAAYNKVSLPTINSPCDGTPATKGILFLTATGSLNACDKNGNAQVYPQQCYNSFCTYPAIANSCPGANCNPGCVSGFGLLAGTTPDIIQTDSTDCVVSIVCCGGN